MKKLFAIVVTSMLAVAAYAQSTLSVSCPNVVSVDEQFNLTFTLEGSDKPSGFNWEVSDDFQLVWGPQTGSSTSIQIINGKTTRTSQYTYTYILLPKKAGKFTIPTAKATVKGKSVESRPVSIEVVSNASSSQSQQSQQGSQSQQSGAATGISDSDIFLRLTLDRRDVVVGEPITATLKLYQRVNIAGFEDARFPSFDGFWSQEIEAPTNIEFQRESYNDMIYNTAVLRKYILIPQQSGKLVIDPSELVCLVNVRVSQGRTGSIFDGFFDDYRTLRKRVTSSAVSVNVAPLPSGAPSSFGGGVGKFSLSAKVSRDSLKAHEAGSLIVTLSGKGNVSLLEAPEVSFPPDFEAYDIKTTDKLDKGSGGTSGSKTFEYPFIPRSHGEFVIEPIKYTYYDVNQRRWVTLQSDPIALNVERSAESEASSPLVVSSGINRTGVKNLGADIRHINVKKQDFASRGSFFVGTSAFWIIASLIVIAAVALWLGLRKLAARRQDVVGAKTRKATKMALKRLKSAEAFLKQNLYGAYYEELHKALLGYVADKLNIQMTDLSKERISEILLGRGVPQEMIDSYIGLLDACEFARYSPSSGQEAMEKHFEEAVNVISSMDSNIKTTIRKGKGTALALILMIVLPASVSANPYADSLWTGAGQAYSEGRWADAVDMYKPILDLGLESPALYCNIGNAYFKDGNYPYAILYYEKALKLDPSYADAKYNLEIAQGFTQDRIDAVPEFILSKLAKDVCYMADSDFWAVFFLVMLAVSAALVLLFLLGKTRAARQTGFFTAIPAILIAVVAICFSTWQKKEYMMLDSAIVTRPVVSVKSSPSSESSTDLFILHEGTKVGIIDDVGEWRNIELSDGRQGWMRSSDMEVI